MQKICEFAQSKWPWLGVIVLGLLLEGVALFYQYVLDEWPCQACIQVRIWVLFYIIAGIVGLIVYRNDLLRKVIHVLAAIPMVGIVERAWYLYGVENGTIISSCHWDLGYFDWTQLHKLVPTIFGIEGGCGKTPELLFGITMAEGLLVLGVVFAIGHLDLLAFDLLGKRLKGQQQN